MPVSRQYCPIFQERSHRGGIAECTPSALRLPCIIRVSFYSRTLICAESPHGGTQGPIRPRRPALGGLGSGLQIAPPCAESSARCLLSDCAGSGDPTLWEIVIESEHPLLLGRFPLPSFPSEGGRRGRTRPQEQLLPLHTSCRGCLTQCLPAAPSSLCCTPTRCGRRFCPLPLVFTPYSDSR